MLERKYIPRSENTYPLKDKMLVVSTNEKGGDLQVGNLKQTVVGECTTGRQPSMVGCFVRKMLTKFLVWGGASDTKCPGQPAGPYTIEKEVPCDKQISSVPVTMPIFETNKDGTSRLTVPADYNGTADDIDMTTVGVYVEDLPPPAGPRKRGKHQSKATRHSPSALGGCGESTKSGGKSRQTKKRYYLRMDIITDTLAQSMEDRYGYDHREAEFEDAIDWCSVPSSFTTSSLGSVSSFHDALQDALVMEACMKESFGAGPSPSVETSATPAQHPQDTVTWRYSTTPASIVGDCADEPKCDIDSDLCGFVVWPWRCTDKPKNKYDADNNSDGASEDESDYEDEECCDEDDDSVVFCEELDDFDDSNSSSGFEEKKVRFNMKPVVHVMRVWDFAYRQARKGDWEMAARDRERFRKRIDDLEPVLGPALQSTVRDKIYAERFSSTQDATASRTSENVENST